MTFNMEDIYKIPSSKDEAKSYKVIHTNGKGYKCNCPGFNYRKRCRHITEVKLGLHLPTLDLPDDISIGEVVQFLKYIST